MHSYQEVVENVIAMTEGRAKKLDLMKLLDLEIQRICNRKRYWWRRKAFSLTTVAGTPTYNLAASGAGLPDIDDFLEMIHLVLVNSTTDHPEIYYEPDPMTQQAMRNDTTRNDPTHWFIEPGTTQTVRLSPVPSSAKTVLGLYWATPNPAVSNPATTIPLIPPQYHYVVAAALQRKVFFYLFGQTDPRYMAANAEYLEGIADLDRFRGPATREAQDFRQSDSSDVVRATS